MADTTAGVTFLGSHFLELDIIATDGNDQFHFLVTFAS